MANYKKPRDKNLKRRKDIAFTSDVIYRNFEDGDMTLKEFKQYLIDKEYKTTKGNEITTQYVHTLLGYGHLPKHMGGNILNIKMVRDTVAVRVTDKVKEFHKGQGEVRKGQEKRGRKPGAKEDALNY